jgi:hypothetical protein
VLPLEVIKSKQASYCKLIAWLLCVAALEGAKAARRFMADDAPFTMTGDWLAHHGSMSKQVMMCFRLCWPVLDTLGMVLAHAVLRFYHDQHYLHFR